MAKFQLLCPATPSSGVSCISCSKDHYYASLPICRPSSDISLVSLLSQRRVYVLFFPESGLPFHLLLSLSPACHYPPSTSTSNCYPDPASTEQPLPQACFDLPPFPALACGPHSTIVFSGAEVHSLSLLDPMFRSALQRALGSKWVLSYELGFLPAGSL